VEVEDLEFYAHKMDDLVGRLDSLIELQQAAQQAKNHITITHKQDGGGFWGGVAVMACISTYLALIIFAVWNVIQISNLVSWEGVYGRELSAVKQQLNQPKP